MNILNIALKEVKRDFRDVKTLVFLLAFPVVLMLILGTALSSAFSNTAAIDNIHVIYKDMTGGSAVSSSFQHFAKSVGDSGVYFKKAESGVNGMKEVQEKNVDGYIEITKDGIRLYENDLGSIEGSIIQGMVTTFADKYNLVSAVEKVAPHEVGTVIAGGSHQNFIQETSLNGAKQPGAMDYYAIAMTTMIAMYGAMGASYLIRSERLEGTATRLVASPISKAEIFIGKILGSIVTSLLCMIIVVVISKFLLKANWGAHLGMVFLVLLTEILFATSFGLGVSYLAKSEGTSRAIIMVFIQVVALFGGAYFKIENGGPINELSPLTWVNNSLMKLIYSNDFLPAIHTALLYVGVSALFLVIATVSLRRREGL